MTRAPSPSSRVGSLAAVAARIGALRHRRPGVRVVMANGLFDLLHVGHLRYLQSASRMGDFLVVAVNNDHSARRLRGPGRPVITGRDRAILIAAIRGVDAVLLFGTDTVTPVLRRLRPDIHCKGTDYSPATVPERDVVLSYGGKVKIAGDEKRHASSSLLKKIGRHRPAKSA